MGHGCFSFDIDPTSGRIAWSGSMGTHGVLVPEGKRIPFNEEDPELLVRAGSPVAYDPRGGRFAVAALGAPTDPGSILRVYDLTSEDPPLSGPRFRDYESAGGNLAGGLRFTTSGALFGAGDGGVRRWDLDAGTEEWLFGGPGEPTQAAIDVTPDGRFLVVLLRDGETGSELRRLPQRSFRIHDLRENSSRDITTHGEQVSVLALDPAGEILVTGDFEGHVRVGRLDGSEPHLLLGHERGRIAAVAISPDRKWIASALGREVRLWPMPDLDRTPFHVRP